MTATSFKTWDESGLVQNPESLAAWFKYAQLELQRADDLVREADRPSWSTNPEHQRTDKQKRDLLHTSYGAHASLASVLSMIFMLTAEKLGHKKIHDPQTGSSTCACGEWSGPTSYTRDDPRSWDTHVRKVALDG